MDPGEVEVDPLGTTTGVFHILISDDEPLVARFVKEALRQQGHFAEVCKDREELLHRLEDEKFRVLFLDLILPGASGLEIVRRIRRQGKNVAVILMSTSIEEDVRAAMEEMNPMEFLQKPFGMGEIRTALQRVTDTIKC